MTESLLSRLTSLTGPDREIDAEIALANGWPCKYERDGSMRPDIPRYTASIDAALTLMPPGSSWDIGSWAPDHDDNDTYYAEVRVPKYIDAYARQPAIALLIAIMRAKEEPAP